MTPSCCRCSTRLPQPVTRVHDALKFVVCERHLLATRLAPNGGSKSVVTGFLVSHSRFMENRKKLRRVPSALPLARAPSFQFA